MSENVPEIRAASQEQQSRSPGTLPAFSWMAALPGIARHSQEGKYVQRKGKPVLEPWGVCYTLLSLSG